MRNIQKYLLVLIPFFLFSCSNFVEPTENKEEIITYKIEYELNGGAWKNGFTTPVTYTKENEIILPTADNVSKTGYVFGGWFETADFSGTAQDKIKKGTKGNKTFYAKWSESNNTRYVVKHFLQNESDDEYTESTVDVQNLTGKTGGETAAAAKAYEGFTVQAFTQKKIAADGSTVVNIYYNRNIITYTFNPNGGNWNNSTENKTVSGRYGAAVTAPANPELTGYTFEKWDATIPETFGTENKNFTASYTVNTNTPYTVQHFKQNINDNDYTLVEGDTKLLAGTTAGPTNANANSYEGFTAQPFTQGIIAADGSSIIKIYYNRNTVIYTFNANGGNWNNSTESKTVSGRYGAAVTPPENPSLTGYTFNGWNVTVPAEYGLTDLSFNATWLASNETPYTVEHWKQNIDDDNYTIAESDTQSLTGTTAAQTNAAANSYVGFTAQQFAQDTIAADGSTVIKIYYNRNTTVYTFNLNGGNWNNSTENKTVNGRYGATVTAPANPALTGYTFNGWNATVPSFFGTENATFTASWTPNTNTAYTVEHWKQNISDDNYVIEENDTQSLTGTTAAQTNAVANSYDGFTAQPFAQKTIAADGSTLIKIYYNRNTITYTFNPDGGHWNYNTENKIVSGRYGEDVTVPANPARMGYTYNSWNVEIPSTFGTEDATFTAVWDPNTDTRYIVQHWIQNVSGDEYTTQAINDDYKVGTTGALTEAAAKGYTGYTPQEITQETIAPDGSTVVKVYYDRNTIIYTFNADGGNWNGNTEAKIVSGLYGSQVTVPENPSRTGYSFVEWNQNIPQTFGYLPKSFTARWSSANVVSVSVVSTDISVTSTATGNDIIFTAEECNSYCWFMDDVEIGNSRTCTVNKVGLTKGYYTITLMAEKAGQYYSYCAQFYVDYAVANAATIENTIAGMTQTGIIKVTGALNTENIRTINSALKALKEAQPQVLVALDLSQATGLTNLENSGANTNEKPDFETHSFYKCTNLSEIILPNSLATIGEKAFLGCENLKMVTIQNGVTEIAMFAFQNCKKLLSITIPASVNNIIKYAFYNCTSLNSVTFANTSGWYSTLRDDHTDGVLLEVSASDKAQNAELVKTNYNRHLFTNN